MTSDSPALRWDELTTEAVREHAAADPVAVLPVAAVEQHGPHLPLSTDRVICEGLLDAALEHLPPDVRVLLLPMQTLGASAEHEAFPGTLSLDASTLETTLFDIGASVARAGVRRLVVFNSHGGNRAVMDTVGLRLRQAFDLLLVKASYFRFPRPDGVALPDGEWRHGLHGGAVETSMMLHLRPELVRTDAIRRFPSLGEELEATLKQLGPEGPASFAWEAGDLSAEGVTGDASLADAEIGARLVRHYAGCLAAVLGDAQRFPLQRLGGDG